jgi:hypothetical protein
LADKAKVYRRVASQSRWSYQEKGARLLEETDRLKEYQKRCSALLSDMEGMAREQLEWQEAGYFDGAQREGVLRLIGEIHSSLAEWQSVARDQESLVHQCRLELAKAKQRKEKSEEKYQAVLRELQNFERELESKELEDIYINTFRHKAR